MVGSSGRGVAQPFALTKQQRSAPAGGASMSISSIASTVALGAGLVVASSAALAADKVVRVWHTETEPQTIKAFNDIARRFEAKNPGIKIEAEGLAWTDLEGKIMAALAAGAPPELSHGQPI